METKETYQLLNEKLQELSQISDHFKVQATECEVIYQSKDEIKKLLYAPKVSPVLKEKQTKCYENLNNLETSLAQVSQVLMHLWDIQRYGKLVAVSKSV